MPNPDGEVSSLSPSEFIARMAGHPNLPDYADLLEQVAAINAVVPTSFPVVDGLPELRIRTDLRVDGYAADIINVIFLNQGVLDFALQAGRQATEAFASLNFPSLLGPNSLARLFFLWSYAHELMHILRRHALVTENFGSNRQISHAFECDADMCSVACLYRMIRAASPNEPPFRCKVLTLTGIYWAMRALAESDLTADGDDQHPSLISRVVDVPHKLSMMIDSGTPDQSASRPQTREEFSDLIAHTYDLERLYMASVHPGISFDAGVLRQYVANSHMSTTQIERRQTWDRIEQFVMQASIISRNLVENNENIVFMNEFNF